MPQPARQQQVRQYDRRQGDRAIQLLTKDMGDVKGTLAAVARTVDELTGRLAPLEEIRRDNEIIERYLTKRSGQSLSRWQRVGLVIGVCAGGLGILTSSIAFLAHSIQ